MLSKYLKRSFAVLLALCFTVFSAASAYADDISDLKEKKQKIEAQIEKAQAEIDKLAEKKEETQETITALDKKISLMQDEIDVLQDDADALQRQITQIEEDIVNTEDEIKKTQAEIDRMQKEFDKNFEEYCQRLRAMYVSGHASSLEVLMTSTDISSILTRSQMIRSVSEQDSAILNGLMEKMSEIEKAKAALESKINKLNEDKVKLEENKKELEENISKIEASKSVLDAEVSKANALMRKLASETAEYQEAISDNREEAAEVERDIQAAYARASHGDGTGSMGGSYGDGSHSGTLGYPTAYRTISAGYPNYSSGRYHGGIDFPCPSGTSVCAAEAGTVIVAKNLNYSYGHYLIVDHGNGLSTLYAHNTTLLVGVGEHVSRGQQIAYSGSTGNSTGPHVHFEVRVNGTRVNPFNYL
ncbi:MAG: peptidoglycan DD-metalloendopeptidase family protein [Eubacterium sp.]|nr:peptidoglycan DD-metalloendopeptidase family protein [Eubacterium sp.]